MASSPAESRDEKVKAMFMGGLVGDALALQGHYEYDAKKIKASIGSYTDFGAPGQGMGGTTHGVGWGEANFHPGKVAGDGTDSGDVAVMLLEQLVQAQGEYTFDGYELYWRKEILENGYGSCNFQTVKGSVCPPGMRPGYINGASRRTLGAIQSRPSARGEARKALAANANCLFGATHLGPLFFLLNGSGPADEELLVKQAVSTVFLSHNNPDPIAASEFLARTLFRIIVNGMRLEVALQSAADHMQHPMISTWLKTAQDKVAEVSDASRPLSREEFADDLALTSLARLWEVGKSEPIKVGKASPVEGSLPGSLYIALRYKNSLEQALIANANVGGDSAVRGIVIGMLLGAVHGADAIPARWTEGLRSGKHVASLMDQLVAQVAERREGARKEL
ncbi:MAG: hypothetical protein WDW38_008714 [Sanguina aurantia]